MNNVINTSTLIGNINNELELRKTKTGKSVMQVELVVPDRFNKEQLHEFTIVCWRDNADYLNQYASKGSQVAITGSLSKRHFTKGGIPQSAIEIVADTVLVINSTKPQTQPEEIDDLPEPPDEPSDPID